VPERSDERILCAILGDGSAAGEDECERRDAPVLRHEEGVERRGGSARWFRPDQFHGLLHAVGS
jgi:hypothetical protein